MKKRLTSFSIRAIIKGLAHDLEMYTHVHKIVQNSTTLLRNNGDIM